jgi:hypothetical protein
MKPMPKYYCRFAAENNLVKHAWRYTLGNQQFPHSGGLRQKEKRLKCGNRILSKASEMINLLEMVNYFYASHILYNTFSYRWRVGLFGDKEFAAFH